jgi:hypothetical protein
VIRSHDWYLKGKIFGDALRRRVAVGGHCLSIKREEERTKLVFGASDTYDTTYSEPNQSENMSNPSPSATAGEATIDQVKKEESIGSQGEAERLYT